MHNVLLEPAGNDRLPAEPLVYHIGARVHRRSTIVVG
jgi:hypothetical protein